MAASRRFEIMAQARRDIHAELCVSATYEDDTTASPIAITVRWQAKSQRVGNISGGDYAEIVSTIDRLIFNREEIAAAGITLTQGGLVKLTEFGNYALELDTEEPPDGPIKNLWTVVRP